jgi:hypothetical protein
VPWSPTFSACLDHHNLNPKPIAGPQTPKRILEKLDRAWEAMLEVSSILRLCLKKYTILYKIDRTADPEREQSK